MKPHEHVRADEVEQLRFGIFLLQSGQGIYRIDHAGAVKLLPAGDEPRDARAGRADHPPAMFGGGDVRLVGRIAGGQHQHPVKLLAFQGVLRHADMPLVDGVKASPHDADAFLGHALPPAYISTLL